MHNTSGLTPIKTAQDSDVYDAQDGLGNACAPHAVEHLRFSHRGQHVGEGAQRSKRRANYVKGKEGREHIEPRLSDRDQQVAGGQVCYARLCMACKHPEQRLQRAAHCRVIADELADGLIEHEERQRIEQSNDHGRKYVVHEKGFARAARVETP